MTNYKFGCRLLNSLYSSLNSQKRSICKVPGFKIYEHVSYIQPSLPSAFKLAVFVPHCHCLSRSFYGSFNRSIQQIPVVTVRYYTENSNKSSRDTSAVGNENSEPKKSLYQRFKSMYRDYWYVLLPVHLVTSAAWFGGFYYLATSGVDIVALLEKLHVSEKVINPLRNGHATTGYLALSYALYKIATPIRYTVTLGGTTLSINYLRKWGYIKPVPSKEKLKEIYHGKKEIFKGKGQSLKDNMMQTFKASENN